MQAPCVLFSCIVEFSRYLFVVWTFLPRVHRTVVQGGDKRLENELRDPRIHARARRNKIK